MHFKAIWSVFHGEDHSLLLADNEHTVLWALIPFVVMTDTREINFLILIITNLTPALHGYYVPQNPLSFKKRKDRDYSRYDWQTLTMLRNTSAVSITCRVSFS